MDNGPGWLPDPEHEDQERYWDGHDWTDQVRPVEAAGDLHLPEHVPELQRALAAATADIDQVEDRLSSLFDRAGSPSGGGGGGAARRSGPILAPGVADEGVSATPDEAGDGAVDDAAAMETGRPSPLHEEFESPALRDDVDTVGDADDADDAGNEDDSLADLDAALAAEAPDKPDRRFFRRRS